MTNSDDQSNLRTVYDQICASYHAVDDFRAKLLGLLPLATGGILVLLNGKEDVNEEFLRPVGIFGFFVTVGLFIHEFIGISKCQELIEKGGKLERALIGSTQVSEKDLKGQFEDRGKAFMGMNRLVAAVVIYAAVLCAWAYLALAFANG